MRRRSYGKRRSSFKAGMRAGKRRARRQMSKFIPMMQRVGIRR